MTVVQQVITLNEVSWQREGKQILDNVSWSVEKGQHWALMGLNGSGKTSLLNLIMGYQWPSKGKVHVFGKQYGTVDIREIRKSIGWVSHSFAERFQRRVSDTVLDIVLSGKFASVGIYEQVTAEDRKQAMHHLRRFHVDHLAKQPYRKLSQGEKQKVMLARCWMANLELIILDEPCSGLDIRSREELLDSIEEMASLPGAPTLIYVSHHIEEMTASITHALLLNDGQVVASGEKQTVITEPLLEQAFQVPLRLRWENNRPWVSVSPQSAHMQG